MLHSRQAQLDLIDLKAAFDQADEQSNGAIKLNEVFNILNSYGVEDFTQDQIQKVVQQVIGEFKEEEDSNILYNQFLEIMNVLGIRKIDTQAQNLHPLSFLGNNEIAYCSYNQGIINIQQIDNESNLEMTWMLNKIDLGYSLNPLNNIQIMMKNPEIFCSEKLSTDLWQWIHESKSNQKFCEGFILQLLDKSENQQPTHKYFGHDIYETEERKKCLQMLGWNGIIDNSKNKSEKYTNYIQNLENNKNYVRAAMISIFHFDYSKAYQSLQKIVDNLSDSEKFLKSILLGLKNIQEYLEQDSQLRPFFYQINNQELPDLNQYSVQRDSMDYVQPELDIFQENPNFSDLEQIDPNIRFVIIKQFYQFIKKLCKDASYDQPFIKVICEFISQDKQTTILSYNELPILDKICYAIRFSNTDQMKSFINKIIESSEKNGQLDGLILVGKKSEKCYNIVQNYINSTNDIQTAGLISIYLSKFGFQNQEKLKSFYQTYKDLLNKMQLYQSRYILDKELFELEKDINNVSASEKLELDKSFVNLCCKQCEKTLSLKTLMQQSRQNNRKGQQTFAQQNMASQFIINQCPNCNNKLQRCIFCTLPINIVNPHNQHLDQKKNSFKSIKNEIITILDDAIVWCQQCNHGGHFNHVNEWFQEYTVCPVSDCNCECSML